MPADRKSSRRTGAVSTTTSRRSRVNRIVSATRDLLGAVAGGRDLAPVEQFAADPKPRHLKEIAVGGEAGKLFDRNGAIANPDDLVVTKGSLKIYDEMRRDDSLGAFMHFRKWSRLASGWKIQPASDAPEDREAAAFIDFAINEFMEPDPRRFLYEIMGAYEYGYALAEKVWGRIDDGEWVGKWGFKKLAPKRPHNFKFAIDELGNLTPEGILNIRGFGDEVPMRVEDFALYSYASEWGNPYGRSDFRRAHTWYVMKKHITRFEAIYFERLAGGFVDCGYDPDLLGENDAELDDMEEALESIGVSTSLLHSNAFTVNMIENSGRGALAYDKAIQTFNSYMARSVLIPDLMGLSTKATGGSYAMAAKHHDVFFVALDGMGGDLTELVFEKQIIRPLIELNYGRKYNLPKFVFKPLSREDKIAILTSFYAAIEKGAVTPTEEDAKWVRSILEAPETDGEKKDEPPKAPGWNPEDEPPAEEPPEEDGPEFDVTEYNTLRRQLKSYELRTDFTLIQKTFDTLERAAADGWKGIAREQLDNMLGAVRRRKIIEGGDYKAVDALQLRKTGDVKRLLTNTLTTAFANAKFQAWREARDRLEKNEFVFERYGVEVLTEPVTPSEAIAFFKAKGLKITAAEMKAYERSAYQIAGVEDATLLARAKDIVTRGIRKGDALWTEAELKRLFDKYIETGRLAADGKVASAYHIETIVRTNISEAYNQGRLEAYHHPDLINEIEGYWYSAVLDDVTTPYCEWMDAHSPFTREEFEREGPPPAHYQCRATFGAFLRGETWKPNKLSTPTSVNRQEGFAWSPKGGVRCLIPTITPAA